LRAAWRFYLAAWLGPVIMAAAACGVAAFTGVWSGQPPHDPVARVAELGAA